MKATPRFQRLWRLLPFLLLLAAATLFLAVNMKTATRFLPWSDDVMQVDAGVNLYLGHGWTSTAWQSQSQHEFWAANIPLYPLLVFLWIKGFGLSIYTVRTLNYVLALLIAGILAGTAYRRKVLSSPWAMLGLFVLLLCNSTLSFVYRSGRGGDLVSMLAAACLFSAYCSSPQSVYRSPLLFLAGVAILPAGINIIPYVLILLTVEFAVHGRIPLRDARVASLGCMAGTLLFFGFLALKHSLVAFISQTFISGYNIAGAALQAALFRNGASMTRLANMLGALSPLNVIRVLLQDPSNIPLILCLALYGISVWRQPSSPRRSAVAYGVAAAIAVPVGMLLAGRYAIYSHWMAAGPILLVFSLTLESLWRERRYAFALIGTLAAVGSAVIGLPHDLAIASAPANVRYETVVRTFDQYVRAGDFVYADHMFYYAAKDRGIPFFAETYGGGHGFPRPTADERSQITVLLVRRETLAGAVEKLGGEWQDIASVPLGTAQILVMRRTPQSSLNTALIERHCVSQEGRIAGQALFENPPGIRQLSKYNSQYAN